MAQTAAQQRRELAAEQVMSERFAQQNKLLLERLEQSNNALAAHMGQLEDRLERRTDSHMLASDNYKTPPV